MRIGFLTLAGGAALAIAALAMPATAGLAPHGEGIGVAGSGVADGAVILAHGQNSGWQNHDYCDWRGDVGWHRHRWNGSLRSCNPPPGWGGGGGGGPGWGGGGGGPPPGWNPGPWQPGCTRIGPITFCPPN